MANGNKKTIRTKKLARQTARKTAKQQGGTLKSRRVAARTAAKEVKGGPKKVTRYGDTYRTILSASSAAGYQAAKSSKKSNKRKSIKSDSSSGFRRSLRAQAARATGRAGGKRAPGRR
tara:strand:+ start:3131 stop:3484 length:354 start_codon:yes stop_codon:yes gene_type:complete